MNALKSLLNKHIKINFNQLKMLNKIFSLFKKLSNKEKPLLEFQILIIKNKANKNSQNKNAVERYTILNYKVIFETFFIIYSLNISN